MSEKTSAKIRSPGPDATHRVGPKAVELSEKDIDDALRLLKLLTGGDNFVEDRSEVDVGGLATVRVPPHGDGGNRWAPLARAIYVSRRRRADHFAQAMLGEPSWDMLLALYMTEQSESRMTTSRLSEHAGAPLTTALRWIDYLEQNDLVKRRPSPTDRRMLFVELTDKGRANLEAYFAGLPSLGFDLP